MTTAQIIQCWRKRSLPSGQVVKMRWLLIFYDREAGGWREIYYQTKAEADAALLAVRQEWTP